MQSKKKWMIFGGTVIAVIAVFLCIAAFFLYKGVNHFFDKEILADQYLEQMVSAASEGDRDTMGSLYLSGSVPENYMEKEIQENIDAWGNREMVSFKKRGLNISSTTSRGAKSKVVECSYRVMADDGQRFTASLKRVETSDGNRGIVSFVIRDAASLAPQGTLRSMGHWSVFQWGLFLLSFLLILSTVVTAVTCYRQHPRYRWGWVILILVAYLSVGFSIVHTPGRREFKVNWAATTVKFSRYVIYSDGSREFRLFLPAGMAVYWIMKRRLDQERNPGGPSGIGEGPCETDKDFPGVAETFPQIEEESWRKP